MRGAKEKEEGKPRKIGFTSEECCLLAVQGWRIEKWLARNKDQEAAGALRYAARKLNEILERHSVQVIDLENHAYDEGLSVEVIDALPNPTNEPLAIVEMIEPIVLLRKRVASFGRVVTGPLPMTEAEYE